MNVEFVTRTLLAGACVLAMSAPAFAQSADANAADEGEIVVTAQNRAENVQDVPIAINVISEEAVKAAGVTDFTAVQRIAPVLNIVNDTVNTRVAIRGIGSNSNDETQDQTVAINIDGEYINRPAALNASLFDIQRVEVLRGPQGTLYGRNATGGAVNFITRKPGDEFGVNGSFSYGNYDHKIVEGGIDIPLGDIGGVRAAGIYSKRKGYNFHPNVNLRSGNDDTWAGRLSLRLEPTDALTIRASVERVDSFVAVAAQANFSFNTAGNVPATAAAGCTASGWQSIGPAVAGVARCIPVSTSNLATVDRSVYNAPTTGVGFTDAESWAYRGGLTYDFGGATLSYNAGYRATDRIGAVTLSPGYRFNNYLDTIDTQSHELRLNGESDTLKWQAGGFFFKEVLDIERGLYRAPPPAFLLGANGGYVNYFTRDVTSKSLAVFGQAEYKFSDAFTLVVGGRYTDDKRRAQFVNYPGGIANPASPLFNTGSVRPTTLPAPIINRALAYDEGNFTWLVGANYTPNDDTLIYAKVSTGFKAGGFDPIGAYNSEKNMAYEAGMKRNFGASSQNLFNLSAFYYDYTDLQVSVLLDTTIGGQVFNAGKSRVWGFEAETKIKLSDNDTFTASVNYVNAKYSSLLVSIPVFCVAAAPASCNSNGNTDTAFANSGTATNVISPDVGGRKPPMTPNWTITIGYDHVFQLGDAGSLTASVFTAFKSTYFTDVFNYNDSRQQGFTNTDLSLTYKPDNGRWSFQGFVRNIENYRSLSYAAFTAAGPDDIYNWQFNQPRTYGARLSFDF